MASVTSAAVLRERQEAVTLLTTGEFDKAEPFIRAALEDTAEQKNAATWMWNQRLAECLIGQGHFKEAEPLAQKAFNGFRRFGAEDEDAIDCKALLAECLEGQRKHVEAMTVANEVLESLEKNTRRGADHPATLKCRALVAVTLKGQCKVVEAHALAKQNFERLQEVLVKAESLETQGSRRLTHGERYSLQKVELLTEVVLGDQAGEVTKGKRSASKQSTISTHVPASDDGFASKDCSRSPSKQSCM